MEHESAKEPLATRTSAWFHSAFAVLAAIMVWAPAIGSIGRFTVVTALCVVALTTLESLRERTSGAPMSRPAGRRGRAILIAVGVVFIALIATSFALVVASRGEFALLCAAVAFAVMFVLAWMHDASIRNREALGQAEI
jgi:4-hydroxybenzoate polyprenyltransferase